MLRSLKELYRYRIGASDGDLGHVEDFYFDDARWLVRYVVVDTGSWLPGRQVLISRATVEQPVRDQKVLFVALTKEQIEKGPSIARDRPVSRQMELELARHFGWDIYWGQGLPTMPAPQGWSPTARRAAAEHMPAERLELRSTREVTGYEVQAVDGRIGDVLDFIADTEDWRIRYLVVDTGNWLPGRKVLVGPERVAEVQWAERKVKLGLSRDTVRSSPPYDPATPINRGMEVQLYDYYGRHAEERRHRERSAQ